MPKNPVPTYQIKVCLNGSRPPIWRRIRVPGNATLLKLHDILQIVMGWHDYHMHQFTIQGQEYSDALSEEPEEAAARPESNFALSQVLPSTGMRFQYVYDFGDGWVHTLLVEKTLPAGAGDRQPVCLDGKRSCPPEDVGGLGGYQEFLLAIADPRHPDHDEYLEWVGGGFDPEAFDLGQVNRRLRRIGRGRSMEGSDPWTLQEREAGESQVDVAPSWAEALSKTERRVAEDLPLRRDVVALVAYVRDNRPKGTQATGNLPVRAVREIWARFTSPPAQEESVAERLLQIHSEIEVWPVFFAHVLVHVAGLASGGPGRRWRLTSLGESFLEAPAPAQVWLLVATWWTRVNWAIASPWDFEEGIPATSLPGAALHQLLGLPAEGRVPFEPFADRLSRDARLEVTIKNPESARRILRVIVERSVIDPLGRFGILESEYEPNQVLGHGYQELCAFRIMPFGKGLLQALGKAVKQDRP